MDNLITNLITHLILFQGELHANPLEHPHDVYVSQWLL